MQFKSLLAAVVAAAPLVSAMPEPALAARQTDAATGILSDLADLPTIPISLAMVLATAVPSSVITDSNAICSAYNGAKPAWFSSLPADAISAIESYGSAISSWASVHSADLASITSTAQLTGFCGAAAASSTASSGASSTGTKTTTGTKSSGASSGTSTASAASTATKSGNGAVAAKPTGAVVAGVMGAIGILGLAIGL